MNPLSLQESLVKNDKLIRKQRYLNTISNKKKLLNFNNNPNITDLEQIRILYNESVSLFNQNVESTAGSGSRTGVNSSVVP